MELEFRKKRCPELGRHHAVALCKTSDVDVTSQSQRRKEEEEVVKNKLRGPPLRLKLEVAKWIPLELKRACRGCHNSL